MKQPVEITQQEMEEIQGMVDQMRILSEINAAPDMSELAYKWNEWADKCAQIAMYHEAQFKLWKQKTSHATENMRLCKQRAKEILELRS